MSCRLVFSNWFNVWWVRQFKDVYHIWKTLEQHQHVLICFVYLVTSLIMSIWLSGQWAAECQSNQSAESHESKKQGNKWAVSMLALNIVQQDTMFLWMVRANWPQHDPRSLPIAVVRKARSDRVQRVIHIAPHMDPGLHATETFNRNGGCYWHWDEWHSPQTQLKKNIILKV
jgi:hypothetical protein